MERRYGVTSSGGRQRAHAVIGNAAPVAYSLHCNATTDVSAAVLDFIACNSSALTVKDCTYISSFVFVFLQRITLHLLLNIFLLHLFCSDYDLAKKFL
jgi:hypothetical protein